MQLSVTLHFFQVVLVAGGVDPVRSGGPRHFRAGLSTAVEGVCPRHFYHELRSCRIFREATNFPIGPGGL